MNQIRYFKIYKSFLRILDWIFPPRCPVCDGLMDSGELIHDNCRRKLFFVKEPCCARCGRPLLSESQEYCMDCARKQKGQRKNNEPGFKQGKSLFLYKGMVKETMYRFKYSNKREYAEYFAREAAESYGDWIRQKGIQVIVPVPMYRHKQRVRGYNQAEVFARALSMELGIPLASNIVKRVRDTVPLKTLNPEERKNNLKNAFQGINNIVKYDHILLIDDIYTTGSTAEAVSQELINTGIKEVYLLCVCIGQGA